MTCLSRARVQVSYAWICMLLNPLLVPHIVIDFLECLSIECSLESEHAFPNDLRLLAVAVFECCRDDFLGFFRTQFRFHWLSSPKHIAIQTSVGFQLFPILLERDRKYLCGIIRIDVHGCRVVDGRWALLIVAICGPWRLLVLLTYILEE